MRTVFYLLSLFLSLSACQKEEEGLNNKEVQPVIPSYFPPIVYPLNANPVTANGFELGKKLFYDTSLSGDGMVACGSCHDPYAAFTQHGHAVSHGIHDLLGTRNSLPVMNMLWNKTFFWDGGVHNLDFVPINAITSEVEMGTSLAAIIDKVQKDPVYPSMFEKAFGSKQISSSTFLKALSQFMVTLVSANSPYDQYLRKEKSLSTVEMEGLALVEKHCSGCHSTALFTDHSFRNNGLPPTEDEGRYKVSLNEHERNAFRVPSLRNLFYTAPYMHDGRFKTLEEVLQHYVHGVTKSNTLDPALQKYQQPGIPLTLAEQDKIIQFLGTLNDASFVRNKLFHE